MQAGHLGSGVAKESGTSAKFIGTSQDRAADAIHATVVIPPPVTTHPIRTTRTTGLFRTIPTVRTFRTTGGFLTFHTSLTFRRVRGFRTTGTIVPESGYTG